MIFGGNRSGDYRSRGEKFGSVKYGGGCLEVRCFDVKGPNE